MATAATIFGATLRRYRTEKRLTQKRLADIAGLSQRFIGQIEAGEQSPGLEALIFLAQALDVSVPELLADFTKELVKGFR